MNLSIITVTWNAHAHIGELIRSLEKGTEGLTVEHIVVDNGSTDDTVEIVRQFPYVRLIENKQNLGFGAANNQAVREATGEFLLFLNPDMRVEAGSLSTLVSWMRDHSRVGIASVKLLDQFGAVNREALPRRFPRLFDQLALIVKAPHFFPSMLHGYLMHGFDPNREQEVDSVRGSFMLMRREIVDRLGWAFDPRYFIWYEDVDICREVHRLGFSVVYTPIVSCVDYVGQSFKQQKTLLKQIRFTRSMLIYFQKWEPWYVWMWIFLLRPVGIGMAWGHDFVTSSRAKPDDRRV